VIRLGAQRIDRVVALGAHCDDIAIGAGGTLHALCAARPGIRVDALVLSGGGTDREDEERAALAAFCPGADLDVTVHKMPDGRLPAHWDEAKNALEELRAGRLDELAAKSFPFLVDPLREDDAELRAVTRGMLHDVGAEAAIRQLECFMTRPDALAGLGAIDMKALVLVGEADRIAPLARAKR